MHWGCYYATVTALDRDIQVDSEVQVDPPSLFVVNAALIQARFVEVSSWVFDSEGIGGM